MPRIYKSSYGGKAGKHISVDGNINICSQGPNGAVHSAQRPRNGILCTGEILTGHTGAFHGYIIILQFGGGGTGVSDSVASLA
jgi:hypothetical protein